MYELFEESVNPTEGAFTVLEWWESQDAIDAHLKSAHIAAFHVKAVTLLGGKPELKYYKSVGL
jgi:quinol monooxygenase YgiN